MKIDMTEGKISSNIIKFAIPIILGNILQQMYVFFDTLFVGRYIGTSGLAALGTVEWIVFIIISGAQGFTHGCAIDIAHSTGKKEQNLIDESIGNSVTLCSFISLLLMVIGLVMGRKLLMLLNTPIDVIDLSWDYLRILIIGLVVTMFYNLFAGMLRSSGNSIIPLKALVLSSFVNIALDYILIVFMKFGVRGAATATVLAQACSMLYCRKHVSQILKVSKKMIVERFNPNKICGLLKLGIPLCFQNVVIGIGGVAVQAVINGYGTIFIAAYTAANKLYVLLEIAASGLGGAVSTFVGQNKGADNYSRVKRGFYISLLFAMVMGAAMSGIMAGFGEIILKMFLGGENVVNMDALKIGKEFLNILAMFFPLLYILYVLYAVIQGLGKTTVSMFASFAQLFMRIICAYFLTQKIGYTAFFIGEVLAWIGSDSMLYVAYLIKMKKWRYVALCNVVEEKL